MVSGTGDGRAGGFGQGPCNAVHGTGTEISSGGLKMVTNASSRFLRPSLIATAALVVAVAFAPRAAAQARGGSGHGSSGHGSSGQGSSGRGSGGGHSVGSSHSGGVSHSSGGSRVSSSRGGVRGGGSHGGGWYNGRYRRGGWGYYPYSWGWGWGWDPFYSSWLWGGPSVTIVTGGDGDADGSADGSVEGNVGVPARTGRYAVVKTDVSPEEAQVFLDGKYIGSADDFDGRPDYLYLGAGKYHLEFRLPGYQTLATDLDVSRGQRVRLDQKLKLEPGKSALDQFAPESKGTPLGRVFTKGGSEAGGPEAEEEAPPAPRRALQRAPRDDGWSDRGMAPAPRQRAPEARMPEERMDVRPEPLPRPAGNRARMRFKVTPEDAAVYVDDKYLGAGEDLAANPRGVVTDPGTHSITVTRPGYKSKTVGVTVRVGSPVDVVVELEK